MKTTMTTQTTALEQFYIELLKDPVLQERLKAATDPESLCELAVELGKEKGFSFTKEEALAAMAIEAAIGGDYLEIGDPLSPGGPVGLSSTNAGEDKGGTGYSGSK